MPAPSSYTEATLKTYMIDALGRVAGQVGLTTASASIGSAILLVERILGVTDVADLTDMVKLETIAAWRAWVTAADAAATSFDVGSDGDTAKLSQVYDHIKERLADAYDAALVYDEVVASTGAGGVAVTTTLDGTPDPYGWSYGPEYG